MKLSKRFLLHIALWLAVIIILLPLALLLIRSFADRWPYPELFPKAWSLRGAKRVLASNSPVGFILASSILLSLTVAFLSAVIATMTARVFYFYDFKFKAILRFLSILPILVPVAAFGMGSGLLFMRLHINHTLFAVIISHLIITLPFSIKIMENVISGTGTKLEEQARVLGAGALRAFIHTSLPLIAPGIVSAMGVSFLLSYTQYFITLLIGGGNVQTFSIIVMPMISGNDQTLSSIYSVLFMASMLFVFIIFNAVSKFITKKCGGNFGLT